jgi:acyl-CoA dehydrogenase
MTIAPLSPCSSTTLAVIAATLAEWNSRALRAARLVDSADEVHQRMLAKFMRDEGRDFWTWSVGNRV